MLKRPTISNVEALLKDGSYVRAAQLAIDISNEDPLVALLARELAAIGNKNPAGRGRRKYETKPSAPDAMYILGASMLYADLIRARKIVDGRPVIETVGATSIVDEATANALLRKHKLHKVEKWQQFPAQARTAAAKAWKVDEEKIWR